MEYKRIKPKKRKFKDHKIFYIFILLLFIGVGYAALTTSLSINGTTNVATNSWNIHFVNLQVKSGSVEGNPSASIQSGNMSISYGAILAQPGDYYEFSVDVKNEGSLPGKVSIVNLTGNNTSYLNTSYAYSNGSSIQVGDILNAGKSKKLTIKAWIPDDIDTSLLPTTDTPITLTFNLQYVQSEEDAPPDATDLIIALADTNSCIEKYEGNVTDEIGITEEATKVYFNKCADKRNVIFGGFCWRMVRTTETGGIKMIYNGEVVDGKCLSTRGDHKGIVQQNNTNQNLSSSYLYGSSFTYNIGTNEFTLLDTSESTWSDSTYESLIGKFTCKSTSDTCSTIYQISYYSSNREAFASVYSIADTNYAQIGKSSFNTSSFYLSSLGYMYNKKYRNNEDIIQSVNAKFGSNYTYDNNSNLYTLSGTTRIIDDWSSNYNTIKDSRYTCWNTNGSCTKLSYIYSSSSNYVDYVNLIEGKSLTDLINEMLFADDVNHYNSVIKGIVDGWFGKEMINKTIMIEDSIYCNNRNIKDYGNWNPNNNGGSLQFGVSDNINSLTCPNLTDQFSTNNNSAKLLYPVALLTYVEYRGANNNVAFKTGTDWWTMSPLYVPGQSVALTNIRQNGSDAPNYPGYSLGIRPVISLAPGNTFASGNGSEDSPWVIQE